MEVQVQLGPPLFAFESHTRWVNHAQSWFEGAFRDGLQRGRYLCLDSVGRVCERGSDFARAEAESTFPVTVYPIDVGGGT